MPDTSLHALDWLVILLYMGLTVGIALRVRLGQTSLADFFLAGRRMPWFVVSVSMYATLFSTLSFVSVPGEAYSNGVLLFINAIGYTIFTPLAVWLFVRFFFSTRTFTAYEYLEKRFDVRVRVLGSLIFLISRALYGGMVFYAAATIFESLVGWDPLTTLLVVGSFTVAYTTIGGQRAIMITDMFQTVVLLAGLAALLVTLSGLIGYDYGGMWSYATEHEHGFGKLLSAEFYSINPYVRYTLWLWLLSSIMGPLANYGTDQLVVQRLLASRSYPDAIRAIWLKTLMSPVLQSLFWGIGLMLFFYYGTRTALPEGISTDQVMGYFIATELPAPVPGLLVAVLLAALMSTIDSAVNSLSIVTSIDLIQRAGLMPASDAAQLRLGRILTVGWGVVVIGLAAALTLAGRGVYTSVLEVAAIWASLWGVLVMVMLAGVLTKWATPRAALVGLTLGIVINLTLPWVLYYGVPAEDRISFAWVGVPGWLVSAAAVFGLSLLDRRKAEDLRGLTLNTVTIAPNEKAGEVVAAGSQP